MNIRTCTYKINVPSKYRCFSSSLFNSSLISLSTLLSLLSRCKRNVTERYDYYSLFPLVTNDSVSDSTNVSRTCGDRLRCNDDNSYDGSNDCDSGNDKNPGAAAANRCWNVPRNENRMPGECWRASYPCAIRKCSASTGSFGNPVCSQHGRSRVPPRCTLNEVKLSR